MFNVHPWLCAHQCIGNKTLQWAVSATTKGSGSSATTLLRLECKRVRSMLRAVGWFNTLCVVHGQLK
eukprot:6293627-Amphidinium_carterae.2